MKFFKNVKKKVVKKAVEKDIEDLFEAAEDILYGFINNPEEALLLFEANRDLVEESAKVTLDVIYAAAPVYKALAKKAKAKKVDRALDNFRKRMKELKEELEKSTPSEQA